MVGPLCTTVLGVSTSILLPSAQAQAQAQAQESAEKNDAGQSINQDSSESSGPIQTSNPVGNDTDPSKDTTSPPPSENSNNEIKSSTNFIWLEYGLGAPGNGLDTTSNHFELGLDFPWTDWLEWGFYVGYFSANKKEAFTFPATSYHEIRHYAVTANTLGLHNRIHFSEEWQGRLSVGLSQTQMEVKSVNTNAPLSSATVGYKQKFPIGMAVQIALQKNWNLNIFNITTELGYNITALNSNHSFNEIYLALVARFPTSTEEKGRFLTPQKVDKIPDSTIEIPPSPPTSSPAAPSAKKSEVDAESNSETKSQDTQP